MAHYAQLNDINEVIYVAYMDNDIIIDENGNEVEELGINHLHTHHGIGKRWVRTSYRGNFRNKYAGIGDIYREDLDAFISPQPYASWSFNETTLQWEPPIPEPKLTEEQLNDEAYIYYYFWDEQTQNWYLNDIDKSTLNTEINYR